MLSYWRLRWSLKLGAHRIGGKLCMSKSCGRSEVLSWSRYQTTAQQHSGLLSVSCWHWPQQSSDRLAYKRCRLRWKMKVNPALRLSGRKETRAGLYLATRRIHVAVVEPCFHPRDRAPAN